MIRWSYRIHVLGSFSSDVGSEWMFITMQFWVEKLGYTETGNSIFLLILRHYHNLLWLQGPTDFLDLFTINCHKSSKLVPTFSSPNQSRLTLLSCIRGKFNTSNIKVKFIHNILPPFLFICHIWEIFLFHIICHFSIPIQH